MRDRLKNLGVQYVYITLADQHKLYWQLEETIESISAGSEDEPDQRGARS